jgi:hypothetical protein
LKEPESRARFGDDRRLVSSLNPNRRVSSPRARRFVSVVLTTGIVGSGIVAWVAPTPRSRGIALVVGIVAVIAAAARRLIAGSSLSTSGKALEDYRRSESNWNPPTSMR